LDYALVRILFLRGFVHPVQGIEGLVLDYEFHDLTAGDEYEIVRVGETKVRKDEHHPGAAALILFA
jgi:hypothetical protein